MVEYYVLMYANGKMRLLKLFWDGGRRIKRTMEERL
jgi:hypothetical protein